MPRRYRNRRIGEFLKELEFTEGRSTGIPKIIHAMKSNGSPPAEFEFDEDHSYFMVRLPAHPTASAVAESVMGEVPGIGTPPVTPPVTPQVRKLLELLSANPPLGSADIRERLGLKDRKHVRQLYIEPAIAEGMIEYTIPGKPNSRLQQYRLTGKGRAALASRQEGKR